VKHFTLLLLALYALFSAYVVLALAAGLPYTPLFTPALTLLAFVFAFLHASQRMGWKRAMLLLALTFGVSLAFESAGVATGLIYGPYHYTDKLGVKFLGLVPLLIPVAWFMMMYPSWVIANRLLPGGWPVWTWRVALAALGGVVMTAWDLSMDPLMVSEGHWVWEVKGSYFGIPLQNYWGWWLTTFVTFALFAFFARELPSTRVRQAYAFDRQAVLLYGITGVSCVCLALIQGLPGPALVGLFAIGPWALVGLLSGRQPQALETGVPAHPIESV
jgi:uncharacterized membrane protein